MEQLKIIFINGINPFEAVPITDEYKKKSGYNGIATMRDKSFTLTASSFEHCSSDKNFIVIENNNKERKYFLVKIEED